MLSEFGPWEKVSVAQTQRTKATQQDLGNHILLCKTSGIGYVPHSSAPRIGNLWALFTKSLYYKELLICLLGQVVRHRTRNAGIVSSNLTGGIHFESKWIFMLINKSFYFSVGTVLCFSTFEITTFCVLLQNLTIAVKKSSPYRLFSAFIRLCLFHKFHFNNSWTLSHP